MKFRETAAGGVVLRDGEVLVLRRHSGEWVMPKGKLRLSETREEAALREVHEESGLSVAIAEPLGTTHYQYPTRSASLVHKTVYWFLMQYTSGDLKLEPSFREGRFLPPEEALRLLTFVNDRDILRTALAKLAGHMEVGP